ncbi:MAG: phasin family protein [Desulfuromonadales bacterium]|nr:phasin family protein [Desulfuromonadales bacterium]
MFEIIEKTLLTGLGALSMSQKKAEELVCELKERLNLSEEEGKKLLDKLQQTAKDNQSKLESVAQDEVKKAFERLGIVTEEEFNTLKKKVDALEKKLKTLEH